MRIFDKNRNLIINPDGVEITEGYISFNFSILKYRFFSLKDEIDLKFKTPLYATRVIVYSYVFGEKGYKEYIINGKHKEEFNKIIQNNEILKLYDISEELYLSDIHIKELEKQKLYNYIINNKNLIICYDYPLFPSFKYNKLFKNKSNIWYSKVLLSLLGYSNNLPLSKIQNKIINNFRKNGILFLGFYEEWK